MYMVYIDNILFPVAPSRIVSETEFENKTYTLIDGSRVNRPGGKGLRKFSFELLLPMSKYPFAQYEEQFYDAEYYVEQLRRIGSENRDVKFDVYRTYHNSGATYLTSVSVLCEKIVITEDAENGEDIRAQLVLREHRSVETKLAERKKSSYETREDGYTAPETYTVKKGDSLWLISKKLYGDGAKYTYLAALNGITKPYTIYPGQVLKVRE
ncbi:MAG: LysM peptidoglycan-binding domain-containing protein [Clostridia bacterium]|nr:LysM peptidoglycan-binding domain-containing protein [Clostridia bacterium]